MKGYCLVCKTVIESNIHLKSLMFYYFYFFNQPKHPPCYSYYNYCSGYCSLSCCVQLLFVSHNSSCRYRSIANCLLCYIQETNLALKEGGPLPTPYGSEDIRPLNMEDFKYAHEQVMHQTMHVIMLKT